MDERRWIMSEQAWIGAAIFAIFFGLRFLGWISKKP